MLDLHGVFFSIGKCIFNLAKNKREVQQKGV